MWKTLFHKRIPAASPTQGQFPPEEATVYCEQASPEKPTGEASVLESPSLHLIHSRDTGAKTAEMSDDSTVERLEPLLEHCPRNIRLLTKLAEAYARKMIFDRSLSLYQRALEVGGTKREDIEMSYAETMLKKLDWEFSQLDPNSPDFEVQRERIQTRRRDYQGHEIESAR
jgi:hypothetical protein